MRPRVFAAPPSGRDVSLDRDVPRELPRFRHVVGKLHAEKVVHVRAERLFDAQGHFRRQRGLAVQKIGKRGAAHFQNLPRLRHVEAEGLHDLGFDQVARIFAKRESGFSQKPDCNDLRSTHATRLSAGGVADEWVTQLLRQTDAKVFKKYSQMKLQMKREAMAKLNRQANEKECA
jgi:hypothetical protein